MNRRILVVNDDGIGHPGIQTLARLAQHFGDVYVVAPAEQNSAMSQRITIHRSYHLEEADFPVPGVRGAWSLDGTPADCVKHGVNAILGFTPDLVFSGVNYGYNAGIDILYSGTVGACMEALVQGVPSIAYSLDKGADYAVVESWFDRVTEMLLPLPIAANEMWNVNFPGVRLEEVRGIRMGVPPSHFEERKPVKYRRTPDPAGGWTLDITEFYESDREIMSDLGVLGQGYISVGKLRNMIL